MEESSAYALFANGLSPFFNTIVPAAVKSPSFIRSRRESRPCDQSCRISKRFRRAFAASLTRALDAFDGRYIQSLLGMASFFRLRAPGTAMSLRAPSQRDGRLAYRTSKGHAVWQR